MELVRLALEAERIVFLGETEIHGLGVRISNARTLEWKHVHQPRESTEMGAKNEPAA